MLEDRIGWGPTMARRPATLNARHLGLGRSLGASSGRSRWSGTA